MAQSSLAKEMRRMVREAEEQGFSVKDKADGWMVLGKDGVSKVMIHKTPSKQGTVRIVRNRLQRLGVKL
jgi:hypothetical protein